MVDSTLEIQGNVPANELTSFRTASAVMERSA